MRDIETRITFADGLSRNVFYLEMFLTFSSRLGDGD